MNRISLKDISKSISSGLTPLRSNTKFWSNGNIPWVKTEQLGVKYIYDSNEKITEFALENTTIKLNPVNTLSIAMYGEGKTRGSVSILKTETTTNQACCNIVLNNNKADIEYVYYFLKTQYENLRNLSTGVRKNLNSNDIKNFKISIPQSIKTQKQIAKILSDLDAKIEVNNKINEELEKIAKTIYDYWFVQFDFPDATGKPYKTSGGKMVFNKLLKRDIPVGWGLNKLGDILNQVTESIEPEEYTELNYLPIDKLPSKKLYYQEYENRNEANSSLIRFQEDDILLGAMRVYFHRVCIAIEDGISRSTMMVLRPNNPIHKNYALFTLNRDEAIEYATKNSTGTSIPYSKWLNNLENHKFSMPSDFNIIEKFNKITNPIIEKLKLNSKENQKLAELRDWLLPMLMNGQVTVKEAQEHINQAAEPQENYG